VACHDQAVTEDAATPEVAQDAEADHVDRDYLRKEAWTMGLYVTVCLLAGLTALESVVAIPGHVFGLVWGTTVGLALAHLFAFRLAGRLVHDGRFPRSDQIVSAIQLAAAAVVALVVSIPVLMWWVTEWHGAPTKAGSARCSSELQSSLWRSSSLGSNMR
jgi:ABC-type amino acid transport system permease subunit